MSLESNLQRESDGDRGKQSRDQGQNACMELSENNVKKVDIWARRGETGGMGKEEGWTRERRKSRRVEEKDEGWKWKRRDGSE